jgi:hypothetical protein
MHHILLADMKVTAVGNIQEMRSFGGSGGLSDAV